MLLALVLAQVVSPIGNPAGPIFNQPSLMNRYACFEFAPSSGAGMGGAPCIPFAVTDASGTRSLTFARASVAECYSNDGQTLTQMASGVARVSSGRADSSLLGVWREESRQNDITQARDLSDASWVKSSMTCTKTATGMRGDANGASTCTATGANGTVIFTVVAAAATREGSLHIKRRTGTGAIAITRDGSTWTTITSNVSSSLWRRTVSRERPGCMGGNCIIVPLLRSSAANPSLGIRLATSGDAVDIDFAQDEAGADATSPIATAGAAVARAAESLSVSYANAVGCISGRVVGAGPLLSRPVLWAYVSSNRFARADYGTTNTSGSAVRCEWYENPTNPTLTNNFTSPGYGSLFQSCTLTGATTARSCFQGSCTSASVSSYTPTSASYTLYFGATNTGSASINGVLSQVTVDPSGTRCPTNEPAQNTSVAWLGDSIIAGTSTFPDHPPRVLRDDYTGKAIINFATGGYTAAQCATRWTDHLSGQGHATLIWSCAVNSLAAGISGAATWATAQAVLDAALAQGMKVIVTQVTPWKNSGGWTAGKQTETAAYNAAASAWATANGAQYVSTSSLGGEGGDADLMLASLDSGDHIHPNVTGAALIAQLVAGANP